MQEHCADVQLDWPDCDTARKLAVGGVIRHKPRDGLGISKEWLARGVAPNISRSLGEGAGAMLGASLLWACFDPAAKDEVADDVRFNVINNFAALETDLPVGENPVERANVVVSETGGC